MKMTERFNRCLSSGGPLECLFQRDENSAYSLLIMNMLKVPGKLSGPSDVMKTIFCFPPAAL